MKPPAGSLRGRVALVTGGSGGLGQEICRQLAVGGTRVAVGHLAGGAAAASLVAEIQAAGGSAVAVSGDVSVAAKVKTLVAATLAELGPIDILVSNAGRVEIRDLKSGTPRAGT